MIHTGVLQYLTWNRPWMVGDVDIRPEFWKVASALLGKRAVHDQAPTSYMLKADPDSALAVFYDSPGEGIILEKQDGGFGFSNVAHYVESAMCFTNGRTVRVTTTRDTFRIAATDQVFGVSYVGGGSTMADVSEADAEKHCKPFTADCCLFACRAPGGWSCAKFSGPLSRALLSRKADGTIRATRIGPCEVLGRKPAGEGS